jgi:hypothetical protein
MFEEASRKKLRFQFRGFITVEDLWDLSLDQLDEIYKVLSRKCKNNEGESLIKSKTENSTEALQMQIVKHIFQIKSEEDNKRKLRAERRVKKTRLQELLNEKQDAQFKEKSADELARLIAELDNED